MFIFGIIIKKALIDQCVISNGWGDRIRTYEMADSESAALPLGYTPMLYYFNAYYYKKTIKIKKWQKEFCHFQFKIIYSATKGFRSLTASLTSIN